MELDLLQLANTHHQHLLYTIQRERACRFFKANTRSLLDAAWQSMLLRLSDLLLYLGRLLRRLANPLPRVSRSQSITLYPRI